ncbi:FBD-associated F-box protein [Salix suchowensis]|nr:FBD-associated F-box protein [Salix suchowensis]
MTATKKTITTRGSMINYSMQELDLITELPEPIIQHIMSFLTYKDAAKMSVLSKHFASAWNCFPSISFDETLNMGSCARLKGKPRLDKFLSYVSGFLSRRPPRIALNIFCFSFNLEDSYEQPINGIDSAIRYAIENKVKELKLDIVGRQKFKFQAHYNLPMKVFSAHSIRVLSLKGFMLEPPQNLTVNFPSIKELNLEKCKGMQTLKISGEKLKIVVIELCQGLDKVEIDASNLESFSFGGEAHSSCRINLVTCKSLKYLSLRNAQVTGEWIKHEVAQFLRLEVLKLVYCRLLENFHVSNSNLKTVELRNCFKLQKIEIYARSLNTFAYGGDLKPSQVIIYSPCVHAKLSLSADRGLSDHWYTNLREFLACFDHCKELEIDCDMDMALIVPINVRKNLLAPLYDLNYLKLVTEQKPENINDLVDGLMWLAPRLSKLSFISNCQEKSLKCWRHSIRKVTMENFEDCENMILEKFLAESALRLEATSREGNACAEV